MMVWVKVSKASRIYDGVRIAKNGIWIPSAMTEPLDHHTGVEVWRNGDKQIAIVPSKSPSAYSVRRQGKTRTVHVGATIAVLGLPKNVYGAKWTELKLADEPITALLIDLTDVKEQ